MKKTIFILLALTINLAAFAQEMTAERYSARGIARDEMGFYQEALSDFNELVKLTPNDAKAWNYRGLVYYHLENFDMALADYNKAIEIDPKFEMAWFNKGTLYLAYKNYDESVTAFTEAIKINPLEGSYSMRGQAYTELKKYDEAIADFNSAIQINGKNGYLYSARGTAKFLKNDKTGACEDFKTAVQLGDDFSQQYIDAYCK